mmetsp:Transcript_20239/g.48239  ORF Transcript_20239/g.48239 Transcript_20239/m.48239 type:complete len:300 (+) Transcript_20239:274-1173(+)
MATKQEPIYLRCLKFRDNNHNERKIKYLKEYVVTTARKMYRYCEKMDWRGVAADELICGSTKQPLFFDLEIKKLRKDFWVTPDTGCRDDQRRGEMDLEYIPEGYCRGVLEDQVDDSRIAFIAAVYKHEWTYGVCRAGIRVLVDHIQDVVESLLLSYNCPGVDEHAIGVMMKDVGVLSGCRQKKSSFHILFRRLICDRTSLTMPLLVYEIARRFSVENLKWVLGHYERLGEDGDEGFCDEVQFRIRALMIEKMYTWQIAKTGGRGGHICRTSGFWIRHRAYRRGCVWSRLSDETCRRFKE